MWSDLLKSALIFHFQGDIGILVILAFISPITWLVYRAISRAPAPPQSSAPRDIGLPETGTLPQIPSAPAITGPPAALPQDQRTDREAV